jgi:hypothetical protein
MTAEQADPKDMDHTFVATYDDDIPWQEDPAIDMLTLPKGVQVKIFRHDPAMKRIDMKVKFPPGYVEPEHTHKSWHSIVVLKGRMCVAGKDLRPGDYVWGRAAAKQCGGQNENPRRSGGQVLPHARLSAWSA